MAEVGACLGLVVEEGYRDHRVAVVAAEVPSQVRVEAVAALACQAGAVAVEVQACQVKEVGEEAGEYQLDPAKEGEVGVVEGQVRRHGQVEVGVEEVGACPHSGQ